MHEELRVAPPRFETVGRNSTANALKDPGAKVVKQGENPLICKPVPHHTPFAPTRHKIGRVQQLQVLRCILLAYPDRLSQHLHSHFTFERQNLEDTDSDWLSQHTQELRHQLDQLVRKRPQ